MYHVIIVLHCTTISYFMQFQHKSQLRRRRPCEKVDCGIYQVTNFNHPWQYFITYMLACTVFQTLFQYLTFGWTWISWDDTTCKLIHEKYHQTRNDSDIKYHMTVNKIQADATAKEPNYVASTNSYSSLHSQAFQPCPHRTIYYYLNQQKSTSSSLHSMRIKVVQFWFAWIPKKEGCACQGGCAIPWRHLQPRTASCPVSPHPQEIRLISWASYQI